MLRVVLDANVVVSGWIQALGPSARILDEATAGRLRVVLSPAIVADYRRSLGYAKVRRRISVPPDVVGVWIDALVLLSDVVPGERRGAVVPADPDDEKYLDAAVEGRVSFVVSGDRHLLDVGTHEGVRILAPRAFLEILEAGEGG